MLSKEQVIQIDNLWKQYPLIQNIYDEKIFGVRSGEYKNKIYCQIYERCDEYFALDLTAEMCDEIVKYFSEIKYILNEV